MNLDPCRRGDDVIQTPDANTAATTKSLTESVEKSLKEVAPINPNWSIYRVPKRLRLVNPEAFTPHLISIGPFHHKETGLADMNEHKWRYMLSLLKRAGTRDPIKELLPSYAQTTLIAEREVRDWYAASIKLSAEELAQILLVDGCFLLELFFRFKERGTSASVLHNDPVFLSEWMVPALRRDLALLENQIPFFVLHRLFYEVVKHDQTLRADFLPIMALEFFQPALDPSVITEPPGAGGNYECKHLLDLLLQRHLPWLPHAGTSRSSRFADSSHGGISVMTSFCTPSCVLRGYGRRAILRNAKSLVNGGVVIKKAEATSSLFDLKFINGELQIPPLHIYWWTESLFRNLVAFEHCCPNNVDSNRREYIVSYIVLMDQLIDTREDVDLLKKEGIITTKVGGSEDVTKFFKDLSNQIVIEEFQFEDLCEEVGKYYGSRWRGWWGEFKQQNFKSPATIAAFVVAMMLFVISLVQMIYAIKQGKK